MTIKSKIHEGGHEMESEWPPRFGTNEGKGFRKVYGEYYKPNNFGTAPIAIMDSMPKTYHEGACREVESRKEWERLDKEHGCITFGSQAEAERPLKLKLKEEKKDYKKGLRKASETALQMHRDNPREMAQKVAKQRETQERIAKQEGLDKGIDQAVQTSLKKVK
jgi:hypothetical protein